MILFKRVFSILLLSCFALLINAQPQQPPVGNFTPKDYGDTHVPENYSICKDERGFIYAGNIGGLLQYDGHSWVFLPIITGVRIDAITYVGNQVIACGGPKMMGLMEPSKKGALQYRSLLNLIPDSLRNDQIITIQKHGSKIFFQSERAIFIYENNKIKTIFPENKFFRSYACENRLFVRDKGVGLMEWKENKFQLFASDTLSKYWGFFGIVSYDKDNFLIAEHELGFYLMNKKSGKIAPATSFFYEDYYPKIYDIEKLEHNQYAIATANHGVIILDKDLELIAKVGRNEGLKSSYVNQITVDNTGNIWAATNGSVSFIDIHSPLHFYNENSGLPGNVEAIQMIGANYYAGTSAGLFLLPNSYNDDLKPWRKIEAINSPVFSLDQNNRDILVASDNGLFAGTLNTFIKISEGDFDAVKFIPGIDKIVAVTNSELFIFNNKYELLSREFLPKKVKRCHSIAYETNGAGFTRVWIGLLDEGVVRLDLYDDGELVLDLFDDMDGLMPGIVKPYKFIGKIIFLTSNGFQHFISEEVVAENLSEEEKLNPAFNRGYFDVFKIPGKDIKGNIKAMWLDNGRIYLNLNDKLCYFDQKGKRHQNEFSTLNTGRINDLICFNNQLWISASEGVAEFKPFHFKKINHPFKVYFRNISSNNGQVYMEEFFNDKNQFSIQQSPDIHSEISYADNSLSFIFSTDYFDHTHQLKYSYLLEGKGEKWSRWSSENQIELNNLHEGEYVLHVKAINVYGTESKEALFRFTILPPWYRTWWAYVIYGLLGILIIFITIKIAVYRLKQNTIRLEKIVKDRTIEIENKNLELQGQHDQILHQKLEITDSINYAKRIQEAILPIKKEIKNVFPDSFVLFKPKDIVSGDFYWFSHHNQLSIFICADCTGHGVPGAFMSMICTDRINHTVLEKKIISPSALLKEVNQGIKRSLKQENESDLKTKDGMDNAVCSFNHQTNELIYAGANRPLWLLRRNTNEIIEYKPTKMAVGGFTPEDQHFDETVIKIEKGDIVYLSTDGYADQFGGAKGKKLMVKTFKEILVQYSSLPFEEQHNKLDKFIEDWRNTKSKDNEHIEQVDDMCIIGIRF
jgi:serine phosphatase RsbU (regulator of sigma subunit)